MRQLTYSDICDEFGIFCYDDEDVRGIPLCQEILDDVEDGRVIDSEGYYIYVEDGCIVCD